MNFKKIIIFILFLNFLSISLYFFYTYGEFKKSEEHFNQKKELIFKSLINKYKLSLDEQFLMNDALAPERGDKIQEFTSLIQRKSNCVIQGVKLTCADSTIYEMLQLKDYLQKEYLIFYAKKYHFETIYFLNFSKK